MIEGLSALPWVQGARRKDKTLLNCETCREYNDDHTREAMGCGWLPRGDRPYDEQPVSVWSYGGSEDLTVPDCCPGYTTALPDVLDVAGCYPHWEKGQLALCCTGEVPGLLVDYCNVLYGAAERFKAHEMKAK